MSDPTGRWGFGDPGPLRDELTALALAGTKTGTASLLVDFEMERAPLPVPGQRDVLIDSDDRPVAIVENLSCRVVRLADVDDEHAIAEGEGYADAAAFPGQPRAVLERVSRRDPEVSRGSGLGVDR